MSVRIPNIQNYKVMDELLFRASTEIGPSEDLLYFRRFAFTQSLSSGSTSDLWFPGGTRDLPKSTAFQASIVSSSANDTFGGTGANIVKVIGLDENYNTVTELVNLSGLTPVTTVNSYITIQRMLAAFCGSSGKNLGNIDATLDGTLYAEVEANHSITHQSHFTVPAGYTLFTVDVKLSIYRSSGSGARRGEVEQFIYSPLANTTYETIKYGMSNDGGVYDNSPRILSQTPEKHTLWFTVTPDANSTAFTSSVGYLLVKGDLNYIDF